MRLSCRKAAGMQIFGGLYRAHKKEGRLPFFFCRVILLCSFHRGFHHTVHRYGNRIWVLPRSGKAGNRSRVYCSGSLLRDSQWSGFQPWFRTFSFPPLHWLALVCAACRKACWQFFENRMQHALAKPSASIGRLHRAARVAKGHAKAFASLAKRLKARFRPKQDGRKKAFFP